MSEPHDPISDETLETYLDEVAAEGIRLDGDVTPALDSSWQQKLILQAQIDAGLRRLFPAAPPVSAEAAEQFAAGATPVIETISVGVARSRRWWPAATALVAAAAIGWLLLANPLFSDRSQGVVFTARPLADVYRETVAEGFEPYYECHEAERFANTFERRQGQALKLLPLGAGAGMLGLSYPGGLSRKTTAMLCRVDDQPVMVFVDRAAADQANASADAGGSLHVFRTERDGLVFYEVTPFDAPRVVDALVPLR